MAWPHAPVHKLGAAGAYIVTCGTYKKEHFFGIPERLDFLTETLLDLAKQYGWQMQAWAVFSNHYHFVAGAPENSRTLRDFIRHLHSVTAKEVNKQDNTPGRKIWFQYWETHLTYERSYLARLAYVHNNAVHHGLVKVASQYRWYSAAWFERTADPPFYKTVMNFPTEKVDIPDAY